MEGVSGPFRVASQETPASLGEVIVFKVLFDRPKDWVDLATLSRMRTGDLDSTYVWSWIDRLLEYDDARRGHLQSIIPRA